MATTSSSVQRWMLRCMVVRVSQFKEGRVRVVLLVRVSPMISVSIPVAVSHPVDHPRRVHHVASLGIEEMLSQR